MLVLVDFPELADRTGRFRYGAPHAVTVGADGARVAFLRSAGPFSAAAGLWVLNVATGAERRIVDGPVDSYATDHLARVAAFAVDGRLFRADLVDLTVDAPATAEPAVDPR